MKKIITFALALIMCLTTFATLSVFAVEEADYIYRENFNGMINPPTQAKDFGIKAFNAFSANAVINNGKFESSNNGSGQAFIDWQLWMYDSTTKSIAESFTFFTEIKMTGDWSNVNEPLFNFGYYNVAADARAYADIVKYNKGTLEMTTASGTVTATPTADAYNTYEFALVYDGAKFTTVTFYLNGTEIGTTDISAKNIPAIDRIRSFINYKEGAGFSMDSFAFVKGAKSIYGTQIPDSEPEVVVSFPTRPTVAESEKSAVKYYYYNDFTGLTADDINTTTNGIADANGFWLNIDNKPDGCYGVTEDGTLLMDDCHFIDFQFYGVKKFSIKEDFVFSMDLKFKTSAASGVIVEAVRRDSQGSWDLKTRVDFTDGHFMWGSQDLGLAPVNEWVLFEMAFDYDDDLGEFTSFKIMLNGTVVAEGNTTTDAMLLQIKHFRLLRYFSGSEEIEVDNLSLISGNKSALYALAPTAEEPDAPGDELPGDDVPAGDENENENNNSSNSSNSNTTKDTTAATQAPASNDTAATEEKKGCSSSITLGVFAMVSTIGIAGGFALRKKED